MRPCALVTAVCNGLAYTRLFLESLMRSGECPDEVIVIDNGSTDGTPDYLGLLAATALRGQAGPALRIVRNETNLGVAVAWNQGIRAAGDRDVCICNNDIVVPAGWLSPLLQELADRPEVGIVSPVERWVAVNFAEVFAPDDAFLARIHYDCAPTFEALDSVYGGFARFAREFMQRHRDTRLPDVGNAACMLIRHELILDIGLFDETLGVAYHEDSDFYLRASLNSRYNRFETHGGVYIHHFGGKSTVYAPPDAMDRSREAFYRKWPHVKADHERMGIP